MPTFIQAYERLHDPSRRFDGAVFMQDVPELGGLRIRNYTDSAMNVFRDFTMLIEGISTHEAVMQSGANLARILRQRRLQEDRIACVALAVIDPQRIPSNSINVASAVGISRDICKIVGGRLARLSVTLGRTSSIELL